MRILTSSLLALTLFALGACCHPDAQRLTPYYRVVTMDKRGNLIASWTAKGEVKRKEEAYTFTAVERCIPIPPSEYRYPLGWRVRIQAPKIVIYRTYMPDWLDGLTPLDVAQEARIEGCSHTVELHEISK